MAVASKNCKSQQWNFLRHAEECQLEQLAAQYRCIIYDRIRMDNGAVVHMKCQLAFLLQCPFRMRYDGGPNGSLYSQCVHNHPQTTPIGGMPLLPISSSHQQQQPTTADNQEQQTMPCLLPAAVAGGAAAADGQKEEGQTDGQEEEVESSSAITKEAAQKGVDESMGNDTETSKYTAADLYRIREIKEELRIELQNKFPNEFHPGAGK